MTSHLRQETSMQDSDRVRARNWLLVKMRTCHAWMGVLVSLLVAAICLSGMILNHKDLFLGQGGPASKPLVASTAATDPIGGPGQAGSRGDGLSTGMALQSLPVSFDQALVLAREHWGQVRIEKIELREEQGWPLYKIKTAEGREITIRADNGQATVKEMYRKERPLQAGSGSGSYNWNQIIKDLHTGKLGGWAGKLLADATAIALLVLALSGVYLWAVPLWRKRQAARRRCFMPPATIAGVPASR